jgi:hypothetical protein
VLRISTYPEKYQRCAGRTYSTRSCRPILRGAQPRDDRSAARTRSGLPGLPVVVVGLPLPDRTWACSTRAGGGLAATAEDPPPVCAPLDWIGSPFVFLGSTRRRSQPHTPLGDGEIVDQLATATPRASGRRRRVRVFGFWLIVRGTGPGGRECSERGIKRRRARKPHQHQQRCVQPSICVHWCARAEPAGASRRAAATVRRGASATQPPQAAGAGPWPLALPPPGRRLARPRSPTRSTASHARR